MVLALILGVFTLVTVTAFTLFSRLAMKSKEESYRYGFLDRTGNELIPPIYEEAQAFSEGLAAVKIGGLWGYIDTFGRMAIPAVFGRARPFSEGLAAVQTDTGYYSSHWGYIDKQGAIAIEPRFWDGGKFSGGYARVTLDFRDKDGFDTHSHGYIDLSGTVVLEDPVWTTYLEQTHFHADGRFPVALSGGVYGFLDLDGRLAVNGSFAEIRSFSCGRAAVAVKGRNPDELKGMLSELAGGSDEGPLVWGYIDTEGEWIVPPSLGYAEDFREGFALANTRNQSKYSRGGHVFFDVDGGMVPGSPFHGADSFSYGLAPVVTDDLSAFYIDSSGQRVLDLEPPLRLVSGGTFYDGIAKVAISGEGGVPTDYFMFSDGRIIFSFPSDRYVKLQPNFSDERLWFVRTVKEDVHMVTTQEVTRLIDMTEAGEYDSYHEWSPSYDLQAKAEVLGRLMADWDTTESDGRKLILEFTRKLNKEWMDSALPITEIVVRYVHLPEVVSMVHKEFLLSGRFCHQLLVSMKAHQVRQEDWQARIRLLAAEKRFSESKKILKACKTYEGIDELLAEF